MSVGLLWLVYILLGALSGGPGTGDDSDLWQAAICAVVGFVLTLIGVVSAAAIPAAKVSNTSSVSTAKIAPSTLFSRLIDISLVLSIGGYLYPFFTPAMERPLWSIVWFWGSLITATVLRIMALINRRSKK